MKKAISEEMKNNNQSIATTMQRTGLVVHVYRSAKQLNDRFLLGRSPSLNSPSARAHGRPLRLHVDTRARAYWEFCTSIRYR